MTLIHRRAALALAGSAAVALMSPAASAAEVFKVGVIASFTGAFASWGTQFQNAINAYQASTAKPSKAQGRGHRSPVRLSRRRERRRRQGEAGRGRAHPAREGQDARRLRTVAPRDGGRRNRDAGEDSRRHHECRHRIDHPRVAILRARQQHAAAMGRVDGQMGCGKRLQEGLHDHQRLRARHDAETYFHKSFKAAGGEIVGSIRTPIQETNFAAYMERALQAKPDAVYMFSARRLALDRIREGVLRARPQAGGHQTARRRRIRRTLSADFSDDVIGTISVNHYTESNTRSENKQMRDQLTKMYGEKGVTDIASVSAWTHRADLRRAQGSRRQCRWHQVHRRHEGQDAGESAWPDHDRSGERDIVQNMYIRRIEKKDGKLVNVDIATIPMVKDPWKLENPPKQ